MATFMKIAFLILGMAAMLRAQGECSDSALPPGARKYINGSLPHRKESAVVFVIRFSDFGCQPCLINFLDFCDSLRAGKVRTGRGRVEIFFTRDDTPESYQETTMRQWLRGNGVEFPFHIIPEKYLDAGRFNHSLVYLLSKGERTDCCGLIPLPWRLQETILARLFSG